MRACLQHLLVIQVVLVLAKHQRQWHCHEATRFALDQLVRAMRIAGHMVLSLVLGGLGELVQALTRSLVHFLLFPEITA